MGVGAKKAYVSKLVGLAGVFVGSQASFCMGPGGSLILHSDDFWHRIQQNIEWRWVVPGHE
jgi:hypothetical protein